MEVIVNNQSIDVPFDLASIPLGKYVEYYNRYGAELDEKLMVLADPDYRRNLEKEDGAMSDDDFELHMQFEIDRHIDEEALSWYSFWTGYDMFDARQHPMIQPLLDQYRLLRFLIKEGLSEAMDFPFTVEWQDETWEILSFCVTPASIMAFNEIITSKEIMRQIHKMSKYRWDAMPYLCAIFLRKKDEAFNDELIQEGSDRLELMNELPMDIAIKVAFFLTVCVATWRNTLVSSAEVAAETVNQN